MATNIEPNAIKKGDIILLPKANHTGTQMIKIESDPKVSESTVTFNGSRMTSATRHDIIVQNSPMQIGLNAKVEVLIQK